MDNNTQNLRRELKRAGLSDQAINAAWPAWWSESAGGSRSAQAELRFALARNLGLSAKSLLGERVEFVWKDNARFKRLSGETAEQQAALTSFGMSIARSLVIASKDGPSVVGRTALEIRASILRSRQFVDLTGLLALCWGVGIPSVYLRVFPLAAKSMQAMAISEAHRFAVLLGKDAMYPASIAFTLAHEIGHIALGHVAPRSAIVDVGDFSSPSERDDDEDAADQFAMALLTGEPQLTIQTSTEHFGARELAREVLEVAPARGIEPGTLVLCLAYRTSRWPTAMAALRHIYARPSPVWREVNQIADRQMNWSLLGSEAREYVRTVMGLNHG